MNSEELERSLRSEFENYLKGVAAELKQETAEFQQRIAAEFDKQRQSIDEAFAAFAARFDSENEFDEAFTSSVAEHLRLARDEGAKITATAFAEAEKLEQETAQKAPSYDAIRDAIDDISSKDSQSSILKALVGHAAEFAPRGAFFIIKNEQLAGWKVFGNTASGADDTIRDVHFPVEANSILGAAVRSVKTVESSFGEHPGDTAFTHPLDLGQPVRMYAIPLVARGRAVAVLYADHGHDATQLSREALETLVKVAGLTVELHAASATHPAAVMAHEEHHDLRPTGEYEATPFTQDQPAEESPEPVTAFEEPAQFEQPAASDFSFSESVSYEGGFPGAEPKTQEIETGSQSFEQAYETPTSGFETAAPEWQPHDEPAFEQSNGTSDSTASFEADGAAETVAYPEVESPFEHPVEQAPADEHRFEEPQRFDSSERFESSPRFEPAPAGSYGSFEPATVAPIAAPPPAVEKSVVPVPGSRLSDRPVDLPIEVPEEERRSHNDARRFARLLVSEIKLYNEKKVLDGRQSRDLYQRLQEAIDRSREMYDKRVQPPVAAKFDYFHYELVNSLAEGEPGRLGSGYPGPTV